MQSRNCRVILAAIVAPSRASRKHALPGIESKKADYGPLSYLRERQYAPVRANVRDSLTTLSIEQLKLVGNIQRSNFSIKRRCQ
jgi:hypothetical protein